MSKPIGYTFAIATRMPKQTFVFCKWLKDLDEAIGYALQELKDRSQYDVEFILIRDGVINAEDPVVWDSRDQVKKVVYQEDLLEADMKRAMDELGHLDPGDCIWTHTPVPEGFQLAAVNARFEERAASVLGDYDGSVDFSRWQPHEKEGFRDYRYKQPGIRAAWMMYLDLALEHFDRFGTVV